MIFETVASRGLAQLSCVVGDPDAASARSSIQAAMSMRTWSWPATSTPGTSSGLLGLAEPLKNSARRPSSPVEPEA